MRARLGIAAVVALIVMATLWGSVPRASANHCTTPPLLKAATINQGLGGYARLARGKEALVRFYLALPTTRCGSGSTAGNVTAIQINSATLAVKNGNTVLTPTGGIAAQADAIGAQVVSTTIANDHPSSPKFVVPGSILAPSTTGTWTATFEATIKYRTKNTRDTVFGPETTIVLMKVDGTNTAITKAVDRQTKALRVLAVPMGQPLSQTANAAMQNGFTAVSRLFPVPDGTPTGPRTGPITGTTGGLRYTLNAGYVDLTGLLGLDGRFCGSALNLSSVQSQLQDFRTDWDLANPDASHADRAVGFIGPENSAGGGASPCAEGYAFVNGTEAWARAVPDGAEPSKTGPITALEVCHTFGCVSPAAINFDGAYHSIFTNADNQAGDAERAYNVLDRRYLADDHTATNVVNPYTNANTVMERSDWSLIQCKLGGTATTECSSPGSTGTLIGVAAGPAFAFRGSTNDTAAGTLVNSYFDLGIARTAPPTASEYHLLQLEGVVIRGDHLIQVGPVQAHADDDEVHADTDTFSAVVPFDQRTTRIEFRKGSQLLWSRTRNNPPVLTSVSSTFAPGGEVRLTENFPDDEHPALSPQGWIAWTQGDDPGEVEVAKIGFLGNAVTVNVGPAGTDDPAWHPAGNRLAFVADGVLYTVTVNINGNTAVLGTPQAVYGDSIDGPSVSHPTYSPDGEEIAFESEGEIWKINASGSGEPTQLTTTGGVASEPSWSWEPGVQRIAYTVEEPVALTRRGGSSNLRTGSEATAKDDDKASSAATTTTRRANASSVSSIFGTRDVMPTRMCADSDAACALRTAIQELIQTLEAFAASNGVDYRPSGSARTSAPVVAQAVETLRAEADTPAAPTTITPTTPLSTSVTFGNSFATISDLCVTWHFIGDLFDPGETVLVKYGGPFGAGGIANTGSTSLRSQIMCSGFQPEEDLLLDGTEPITLSVEGGSVTVGAFVVSVTGDSTAPVGYRIATEATSYEVAQGGSVAIQTTVTDEPGAPAPPAVTLSSRTLVPAGSFSTTPSSGTPTFTSFGTLQTSSSTDPGTYRLVITAKGGGFTRSFEVTVTVCVVCVTVAGLDVNTTADGSSEADMTDNVCESSEGGCTLREAIRIANASSSYNSITFSVGGGGPETIQPTSALPAITDPVTIDGTTQEGFVGSPLIELDGSAAGSAHGFDVTAGSTTIKGFVIDDFGLDGVHLETGGGNTVVGNWIGTDQSGQEPSANLGDGIQMQGSDGNQIGGTSATARNVVSASDGHGIFMFASDDNVVEGNYVGTDVDGEEAFGNTIDGIAVDGGSNNDIGPGNVTSGNNNQGVAIFSVGSGFESSGNTVVGNTVGLGAGGLPLSNGGQGVLIASGVGNVISQNSISDNGALGINLAPPDGINPNDPDPGDGPNALQNFPVLTSATRGALTTVSGTLNSEATEDYTIEFFASATCDGTHGEGTRYLGFVGTSTNSDGNASFTVGELGATTASESITATATDEDGNTSEFSACLTEATGSADLGVALSDTPDPVTSGNNVTLGVGIANAGPDASTGSTVTVEHDLRLTFVSSTNGSCEVVDDLNVSCSVGPISADGDTNFTITFDTSGTGLVSTDATIVGAEDDTNSDNDTDTETTQINAVTEDGIYVLDPDNPAAPDTKLVSNASEPALSPAGTLFFTRNGGLWVANGDGTDETELTDSGRWASPMGGEVAFQRFVGAIEGGQWELFLMTQRRTITAVATDEIPANLRFLYFFDCGADKHPLGNRTGVVSGSQATSELAFDTGGACGSGESTGTVTVIASDGIDLSVERPTTSFEVERSAPVAAISSPQAGAGYTDDQTITLHGSAYDHEGRQLPGGSLRWTSPDGLFTGTKTGNTVVLPPADGDLNGRLYTAIMTATDADGQVSAPVKTTIVVYSDTDQDGLTNKVENGTCFPAGAANDPLNAFADAPPYDNDGIPAIDDVNTAGDPFTSNGPCVAAQSYQAIVNFDPDELNIPSTGGTATAYVELPYRNMTQSVCSSVRISAIDGTSYVQLNSGSSIQGSQCVAKFNRAPLAAELVARGVMNRAVRITISGTVAGKQFSGDGSTFVKQS